MVNKDPPFLTYRW